MMSFHDSSESPAERPSPPAAGASRAPRGSWTRIAGAFAAGITVAGGIAWAVLPGGASRWFVERAPVPSRTRGISAMNESPARFASARPRLGPWTAEVARGVHLLGEAEPNAAYVVETSVGLVLVDTCADPAAVPVIRQVQKVGLDVRRLRAILLTHAHADHSLGAEKLREMSGAKVYAGRGDCGVLREGGPDEAFFSVFEMGLKAHPTRIDVELGGGEAIEVGDTTFHAISTPGHTPGSTCYLLVRDGQRILFTGDVVMSLTDPDPYSGAGIYAAHLAPCYRGDPRAFIASLEMLRSLPPPDVVLPGHPRLDATPPDPRIAPEAWTLLLEHAIGRLHVLLGRHAVDGPDFLDGEPKELLPGLSYLGDFRGRAAFLFETPEGRSFLFGVGAGAELAQALGEKRVAAGLAPIRPTAVLVASCARSTVEGLRRVVEATGCAVVAPEAGLRDLRTACPPGTVFRSSESLAASGWFPAEAMPIAGAGVPTVAYAVRWAGKKVLLSGCLPARIEAYDGESRLRSVSERVRQGGAFRQSLDQLARFAPDVWLPTVPAHRQNANVYDRQWADALRANRKLSE